MMTHMRIAQKYRCPAAQSPGPGLVALVRAGFEYPRFTTTAPSKEERCASRKTLDRNNAHCWRARDAHARCEKAELGRHPSALGPAHAAPRARTSGASTRTGNQSLARAACEATLAVISSRALIKIYNRSKTLLFGVTPARPIEKAARVSSIHGLAASGLRT